MNKDFTDGYEEAKRAIKAALGRGNGPSAPGQGMQLPDGANPVPVDPKGDQKDGRSDSDGSPRDSNDPNDKNTGDARNEKQNDSRGLEKTPSTPGGLLDEKTADEIVKAEGYDKNSESVDQATKGMEEKVKKTMGNAPGCLKTKLEGMYNTNTNWKKELRKVVGHSISPEEKRSAYANKNVLVSQDRVSRTEKDRFDHIDYIMCCIDTSGSLSEDQLRLILSEAYSLALQKKPLTLVVVQCDTKIQDVKIYNNIRDLKRDSKVATIKGGGGTELKPCWDLLKDDPRFKKRRCELFMVFTDGYLDQYPRDRKTMQHLCWCITDNPGFDVRYPEKCTYKIHFDTDTIR